MCVCCREKYIYLLTYLLTYYLLFKRGNVPKTVPFVHLNLIFLVNRSARYQTVGILVKFSLSNNFVVLIRVGSRTGSGKMIQIQSDPDPPY